MEKKKSNILFNGFFGIILFIVNFNLGIMSFIGYVSSVIIFFKLGIFWKSKTVPAFLFAGGLLMSLAFNKALPKSIYFFKQGDLIAGILIVVLAIFLAKKGVSFNFGKPLRD